MSRISRNFLRGFCVASLACVFGTLDSSFITPNYHVKSAALAQDLNAKSHGGEHQVQIFHQGMISHVNLAFEYGLKDNIDSDVAGVDRNVLMHDIAALLMNYPEAYDYWEIVNLSITKDILAMYPQLDYLTLTLGMMPRELIPYYCVSTVTRWSNDQVEEHWAFEVRNVTVQDHSLDAYVSYTYRDEAHYPDFLEARNLLLDYLSMLQPNDLSLSEIEESLAQHLLAHYPHDISSVAIQLR